MSRKSIDSRMDRIVDVLLPPGSMARREHDLPPEMRGALDQWRREQAAIISRAEKEHGPDWYGLTIDDELEFPPMPTVLKDALGLIDPPVITESMTADEAARLWNDYCHGDER
ncbi:hypothetical protein [Qipengyuania sp.]|uniref:hypothetical protein n=1 Tax=Qipengyuania sp. TaxID=2004515 RepID=UPI0037367137